MKPRFQSIPEKKLVGMKSNMSLANDTTPKLWRGFMPRRKEIKNAIGNDLYSVQVYGPMYFKNFSPSTIFEKWASVEVTDFNSVPEEMEAFSVPSGLYAVFLYKGAASEFYKTAQYIFEGWLPKSGYVLDNRPHLAVMGEKYKNNCPDSEEEIWIPIKQ